MSDTELLDVVAVDTTGLVAWVEKELQRKRADEVIASLNASPLYQRQYVTAPCGRYAKGDRYVAEEEGQ